MCLSGGVARMLSPSRNRGGARILGSSHFCLWGGLACIPGGAPFVSSGSVACAPSGNGRGGLGRVSYLCALLRHVPTARIELH